jgi:maleate isomerase
VVKALIEDGAATKAVTQPVDALISACKALSLQKLGFVSPYVEDVSGDLRDVLLSAGIESPAFGSFEEAEEAKVARITPASLMAAADTVAAKGGIDALFLSCTNLRTLSVIEPLEARLGIPVLSSNQVLAWHMAELAGATGDARIPGRLGNAAL